MRFATYTMLVIEDCDYELEALQKVLDAELPSLPITLKVVIARDLTEAEAFLAEADIIMTDVFFPKALGMRKEPNGQKIVEYALANSKPVVWVTNKWHHGDRKTNSISEWGRRRGLEMFDCRKVTYKPWCEALYGLLWLLANVEHGSVTFTEGVMQQIIVPYEGSSVSCYPVVDAVRSAATRLLYGFSRAGEKDLVYTQMLAMGFPGPRPKPPPDRN